MEEQPEAIDDNRQPIRHEQRLQKIMAAAGIASRRKSEELILGGRVRINGQVVTELGTKADPDQDHIRVDGKLLQGREKLRYYMLNKPKGYVTTVSDPENRPTVMKFFERAGARVYPVGRLDYQSEGLLLVTNDGDLANRLTKASSKVEKTYLVKVSGKPNESAINQIRGGIMIDRGKKDSREGRVLTQPAGIRMVRDGDNPWYEVTLTEGRNRQIRKLFEEIGHFVEKIRRIGYGPLVLDVAPGEIRELNADEVLSLHRASVGVHGKKAAPIKIPKLGTASKRTGARPPSRRRGPASKAPRR
jgi:23S rRNA pseudouridine2605 synthase